MDKDKEKPSGIRPANGEGGPEPSLRPEAGEELRSPEDADESVAASRGEALIEVGAGTGEAEDADESVAASRGAAPVKVDAGAGEAGEAGEVGEVGEVGEAGEEESRGIIGAVLAWRRRRKQRREASYLLREVRRILGARRRRAWIPKAILEEIEASVAELRAVLKKRPWSEARVGEQLGRVEDLVDAHLAFARKSTLREYAEAIGMAAVVAVVLRFFVIQPFKIPSGSMIPTLEVGDHIFVNKFSYGLRVPFTKDPPRHFVSWGKPERGEVVVFIHQKKPDQDFIKRVIAVGGDRIKVEKGQISLQRGGKGDWSKVKRSFIQGPCSHMDKHEADNTWYRVENCTRYEETLDGHRYTTVYVPTMHGALRDYPPLDDFRRTAVPVGFGFEPADEVLDPYRVPDGHVFVMGDNRHNSTDSRDLGEVGFIPRAYIKGRATLVWSSWGPESFRWGRIGTRIH